MRGRSMHQGVRQAPANAVWTRGGAGAAANGRAKVTVPVDEGETLKSRAQATGEKSSHQRVGRMVGHDRDARLEGRIYDNSVVTMAW